MTSTAQQLRDLFPPDQLEALDRVSEALRTDPKSLDNHSRENRDGKQAA